MGAKRECQKGFEPAFGTSLFTLAAASAAA